MYSVHQHWDPLKVCIVGKSYSPEFYHFIKNDRIRVVFERIARETEEDFQQLITLLESFGVKVLRPIVSDNYLECMNPGEGNILPPPMTPRDYSIMLGTDFYFKTNHDDSIPGTDWSEVIADIKLAGNRVLIGLEAAAPELTNFNSAQSIRLGKDIYIGSHDLNSGRIETYNRLVDKLPDTYRYTYVDTGGHSDAVLCPVKPGLIVSLKDITNYEKTFPGWEVVYLHKQSWWKVRAFLELKQKNNGKWWVPGEELNDEFTEFVEGWLNHWVGYVEETVFDVNMLVIDQQNVVCNNYNEQVFDAFERHGITPHIINFRHRYFWDGGLHCITSDVHREGTQQDYFPERG